MLETLTMKHKDISITLSEDEVEAMAVMLQWAIEKSPFFSDTMEVRVANVLDFIYANTSCKKPPLDSLSADGDTLHVRSN